MAAVRAGLNLPQSGALRRIIGEERVLGLLPACDAVVGTNRLTADWQSLGD
jgi:hypothetical protein